MKLTWNWLCDHLETKASLGEITTALTMLGLEVEGVVDRAAALKPFTIARIIDAKPHPNADNLQLCTVDTGAAEVGVICGAPNARTGLVGVFAPVGAYVPGIDLTLTEAEIRGVKSSGMLCSEREMMLSDEHDGIIELGPDAPIGGSFAAWAGLDDAVIDLAITPNRGDCLGVRGIARDLAAAGLGRLKPLKTPSINTKKPSRIKWLIDLPADKTHLVPRVAGRSFYGVTNGASPRWMQNRLNAVGQRPISALVDITNYIMLDLGRPLHAYDSSTIKGDALIIHLANDGDVIEALNEKTYTLDPTMLVIGDADGTHDLAGIMGGMRSGVSDNTSEMFLEMAVFDPISVATTGRKLNIHSDARYRFERGLDVTSPDWAMDYVTALVLDICGGEASVIETAGARAEWQRRIPFNPDLVKGVTGVEVGRDKQKSILTALGFEVEDSQEIWQIQPPPWRGDIDGDADLVEEIIRIHGFDAIAETPLPRLSVVATPAVDARQKRPFALRRLLASRGMMEVVSFSFLAQKTAERFGGGGESLRLINPISSDLAVMRPSLLPNLLAAMARNSARGEGDAGLFEIASIFHGDTALEQRLTVAGIRHGVTSPRHWHTPSRAVNWADAKADAYAVLASLGVNTTSLHAVKTAPNYYHPGQSGALYQGRELLGYFGALHPSILAEFGLKGGCVGFEIPLDSIRLAKAKTTIRPLAELPTLQPVGRDFAFILDEGVSAESLLKTIRGAGKPLLTDATIFDVYTGAGVAKGQKSVAVAVTLQPIKATLTDSDIDTIAATITQAVATNCGGVLRS